MQVKNLIKIAFKAIGTNKLRSFLTMLGIIIGVASVIAMLAIGQGSSQSITSGISDMGSNMMIIMPGSENFRGLRMGPSNIQSLTVKDYKDLKDKATYLSAVSPVTNGGGQAIYGSNNWPVSILGANTDILSIRKYKIKSGDMFTERDVIASAKVCVIGKTIVDNLFVNGEDPIGKTVRFNKIPFKVIGVLTTKGENTMGQDQDDVIISPYTTVQKRITANTYLQSIFASAVSENMSDKAAEEITAILRQNHKIKAGDEDDFSVRSQQELIKTLSSTSQILTVLLAIIAGISLLVGGIGIMNIMYVSVTERTREIGLRIAVGAQTNNVLYQFLFESVLLSFTGGLIGITLGVATSFIIKSILQWPITVSTYSILLSFAVCTFTGIFFGWYPARKASRLDPIEALRYE
ncbi:MAG: ABC transporter permease [Bacteroidetes bacterium]|nr:ABC transporter permease [Bacteroidota bacterium]